MITQTKLEKKNVFIKKSVIRRIQLTLFLITVLMFLTSCTIQRTEKTNIDQYKSGYGGVNVELSLNSKTVNRNQQFPVTIIIENQGAYDAELLGQLMIESPYLVFKESKNKIVEQKEEKLIISLQKTELKGVNIDHPVPSRYLDQVFLEANIPQFKTKDELSVFLDYCYSYSLELSTTLCINPHSNTDYVNAVCEVNDVTLKNGQGSIVSVDKISSSQYVNQQRTEIQMKIYFNNHGNGKIKSFTSNLENCFDISYYNTDQNNNARNYAIQKVKISEFYIGSQRRKDLEKEYVLNEDNSITLVFNVDSTDPYLANIYFKVDYIYQDFVDTVVYVH